MMEELTLLGLSHKTAPLEVREKLAFWGTDDLSDALDSVSFIPQIRELVILSTCNRVEVYAVLDRPEEGEGVLLEFLSQCRGVPEEDFRGFSYFKRAEEVARHLFSVASSLDSMVVGEPQILGQLKEAYTLAVERGTVGFLLHRLFQRAFFVGKRVRRETAIGDGAISVSYVAVELAKKIFGDLQDKSVLIVGAGEMCELAAKHLRAAGVRTLRVANRTWQRALDLAQRMGGEAVPFEGLRNFLGDSDIVLSSTGASRPIILKDDVSMALRRRKGRPIFFIDLAVPRDIDPGVNELSDAYLYDIDDLKAVAQENARDRLKEAERARELVEEEVEKFTRWYRSLEAAPTIRELREWAERVRERELQDALKGLDLDERDRERIERMSHRILNKLLHPAIDFLKHTAANGRGKEYVEMVRCLFGLREP